jgi:hypothetical protein
MVSETFTVAGSAQEHARGSTRVNWDHWRALLASAPAQRHALHALVLGIGALSLLVGLR